jgi:type IV secretory pathway TrbD component
LSAGWEPCARLATAEFEVVLTNAAFLSSIINIFCCQLWLIIYFSLMCYLVCLQCNLVTR